MKNLHLLPNDKFTEPYIEFMHRHFRCDDHLFLILGEGRRTRITPRDNVRRISRDAISVACVIRDAHRSEKIFLHGLFHRSLVLMLFMQPWLLRKCYWLIWGGDLYWYKDRDRSLQSHVYEAVRRRVIRNLRGVITHIKGDYELAQKWYGTKAEYYYSFMYPSNLFGEHKLPEVKKPNGTIYIQVGNSADPSNNHLEVFEKLKEYQDAPIVVVCPLSYGSNRYREKVIREGIAIFGHKFSPMLDFLPFEDYLEMLAKIDVAVFNHKRQQAMGNIITLLGLGKKVYIRDDITTWRFCESVGLKVYSVNESLSGILNEPPKSEKESNMYFVRKYFSEDRLVADWRDIFNEGAQDEEDSVLPYE